LWRQCPYCGAHRREWRCRHQVVHAGEQSASRPPVVRRVAGVRVVRRVRPRGSLHRREPEAASRQAPGDLRRASPREVDAHRPVALPAVPAVRRAVPDVQTPAILVMIVGPLVVRPIRDHHVPIVVRRVAPRTDPTAVRIRAMIVGPGAAARTPASLVRVSDATNVAMIVGPRVGSAVVDRADPGRLPIAAVPGRLDRRPVVLDARAIGTSARSGLRALSGFVSRISPMRSRPINSISRLRSNCVRSLTGWRKSLPVIS